MGSVVKTSRLFFVTKLNVVFFRMLYVMFLDLGHFHVDVLTSLPQSSPVWDSFRYMVSEHNSGFTTVRDLAADGISGTSTNYESFIDFINNPALTLDPLLNFSLILQELKQFLIGILSSEPMKRLNFYEIDSQRLTIIFRFLYNRCAQFTDHLLWLIHGIDDYKNTPLVDSAVQIKDNLVTIIKDIQMCNERVFISYTEENSFMKTQGVIPNPPFLDTTASLDAFAGCITDLHYFLSQLLQDLRAA